MDKVIRGILNDGKVRIFVADVSNTCKEICNRHHTTPVVSDAISRVVAVSAIMAAMQKNGRLNVKIEANGPIKQIMVDANSSGDIRAFATNTQVDIPLKANGKLDVGTAIGNLGVLTVTRKLDMKQDFTSDVILQSGEIGDDFAFYFQESEQVPSVVAVGCKVDKEQQVQYAGAIIVQMMPDATDVDYQYVEKFASQCPPMYEILAQETTLNETIQYLFPEITFLGESPVQFYCNCSKKRIISSLATLDKKELYDMLDEKKSFEVKCEFCGTKHVIDPVDIGEALAIINHKN